MEPRWVNLYGVPTWERSNGSPQSNCAFLGRVLYSLHINSNESPHLTAGTSQQQIEPIEEDYELWADIYDLKACDNLVGSRSVWVTV